VRALSALFVTLMLLSGQAFARPAMTVEPAAADGRPGLVVVETEYYRISFDRIKQGGAAKALHKKWNIDIRAEDYYGTHLPLFHPFVIQADPDPVTGFTRGVKGEQQRGGLVRAEHEVLRHTDDELVIEFAWKNPKGDAPEWMQKLVHRKRLLFTDRSPVIRVEYEVENTDAEDRSVLPVFWNSASLGRVDVRTSALAGDELVFGRDSGREGISSHVLLPSIAGSFIGGVSENGSGVGYAYDWRDVDAMQMSNFKTVGSTYAVIMRRQVIPAGGKLVVPCVFMTCDGLPQLEGMENDLAGGMKLDQKKDAPSPLAVTLVSGSPRKTVLSVTCRRLEDGALVLEEKRELDLGVDQAQSVSVAVPLMENGLYELMAVADDGKGTALRLQRGIEIGLSRKTWVPIPPPGEKRGVADGSMTLYPARLHKQFRTIDREFTTQHMPFLANHAKGKVKAFFFTVANPTLCHVREIVERGDFEYEYAAVEMVANPKGELNALALQDFAAAYKEHAPEVMVLLGADLDSGFRDKHFGPILKRVQSGMGLVLQSPAPGKGSLLGKLMPAWTRVEGVETPCLATPKTGLACAEHYRYGQGRIVFYPTPMRYYRDEGEMLIGGWTTLGESAVAEDGWRGFEYAYASLADSIRWAAGRESAVTVAGASLDGREVTVTLRNAGQPVKASLAVQARSRRWEVRGGAESALDLPAGESAHALTLDQAPLAGPLALEMTVKDAATGKTLAFGSAAANGGPTSIDVTCEPMARARTDPGSVQVAVKNHPGAGTLRVRLTDRFGRAVQVADRQVPDGNPFTAEFALDAARAVDMYHEITPEFIPQGADAPSAQGFGWVALMPAKLPYEYRYVAGVAGSPERKTKHIQGMLEACRQGRLEMHSHANKWCHSTMYRSGGYACAYAFTDAKKYKLDKQNAMNPPLLQSEETLAKRKEAWQKTVRSQVATGARAILLDDERRFGGEWDFSPPTLAAFREHLERRYRTIGALNRSWGASFPDFGAVMPKTLAELEAGESESRAQWLEHRMFCGELLAENHIRLPHDWAQEIDPRLSVGELGIYAASALYPVDWAKYAKYYQHTQRYAMADEFRSFAPGINHGLWAGYGWTAFQGPQRVVAWQNLFDGGHWIFFWEMRSAGEIWYAVVTSDLRLTESYQTICREELPDIMGGLDQMIIASTDQDQGVAVAYSYPSLMLGGDKGRRSPGIAGASTDILRSTGYTYRFVDLKGEAMPRRAEEPYRLLIAQHLSCRGKDEAQHIEAFAAAGNPVLIVGRTGWLDTVGAVHEGGAVGDRLCGVDTANSTPVSQPVSADWQGGPLKLIVERRGVKATDAEVLIRARIGEEDVPVLTCRQVGKGRVYYLNSTLDGQATTYSGGAAGEESVSVAGPAEIRASHLAIYRHLLGQAGLAPGATVLRDGKPVESGEVWTYLSPAGRSRYLGLCPNRDHKNGEAFAAELHFAGEPAHIYNLRTQQYLGHGASATELCAPFRFKAYALLPYKVTGLVAGADREEAAPGETVKLSFSVQVDQGEADLHGIRVVVAKPDGKPIAAYAQVVLARSGRAECVLPLALNNAPGDYTVTAMDCVSGCQAKIVLKIREP